MCNMVLGTYVRLLVGQPSVRFTAWLRALSRSPDPPTTAVTGLPGFRFAHRTGRVLLDRKT